MSTPNKAKQTSQQVDIAILGGGSAGITLASKLNNISTLVIEPRTPTERDCSWALWADSSQQQEFAAASKGSWNQWRLIDHSQEIIHSSEYYRYTSLSAADYISACESKLADGVALVRAAAEDIVSIGSGGSFTAGGQHYSAAQLFDSRPAKMADE